MAHPPHRRMDRGSRYQLVAIAAVLGLLVAVVVLVARSPNVIGITATHNGHAPSVVVGTPKP